MTKNIIGLMAGSVNTLLIIISMKCSLNQFLSNNIIIVICIASPFFGWNILVLWYKNSKL